MITINFFTLLRLEMGINGIEIHLNEPMKVGDVLMKSEKILKKPFLYSLLDGGSLLDRTIILLNGRNIRHINSLNTLVKNGDRIDIFPPGGGG